MQTTGARIERRPADRARTRQPYRRNAMSGPLAKAARLKPEIRLAQAVSHFEADLSDDQKARFNSYKQKSCSLAPDISDVMQLTAEIDRRFAQRIGGGRCFGPRLTNILQAVQQYAALGDIIVGGSQNIIACSVWSLVRMTFQVGFLITTGGILPV